VGRAGGGHKQYLIHHPLAQGFSADLEMGVMDGVERTAE